MSDKLMVGLDVGSTTVKAVVVQGDDHEIVWQDYQRHNTNQSGCVLDFLQRIHERFPGNQTADFEFFLTGSGAGPLIDVLGARFVQEVNAVNMAVEALHPDVGSVVELGGQDAKIIIFRTHPETGERVATTSMNDKCASGTGATIDKCMLKVGIEPEVAATIPFQGDHLHHVAAKCGVFAETDIVNLVKSGVPAEEIMCSLADAIVSQNLSVLTRGNTLRHKVLLLGGPNTYLRFLQECWRKRIPEVWASRAYDYPNDVPIDELIFVPDNAELYAAFGAVLFGQEDVSNAPAYRGHKPLEEFVANGRTASLAEVSGPGLGLEGDSLRKFTERYQVPVFQARSPSNLKTMPVYAGLDGGSTSSKCVLLDEEGEIFLKTYRLSEGNPVEDMRRMLQALESDAAKLGCTLDVRGFGVTGYAADVLEASLQVDVNLVETVAHMNAALHFFPETDVICDIGGQDIKVLMVKNGELRDFRLSNQCSAGNGMLLQAMADQFGVPVESFADQAFAAELSPEFSYGCAVFLDSDRVNFQKEGYDRQQMMAGLARVLPKNVWQYVVQIPRMAELGNHYVLQGGTQYNLAAVKAQVDYIEERVPDAQVHVHPHPGEAGAIGAALEARRLAQRNGKTSFIGIEAAIGLSYTTLNDASTTCTFCPNHCSRTFIDTQLPEGGVSRYISGFSCEKGTVEDKPALQALEAERKQRMQAYPNLVLDEAALCFKHFYEPEPLPPARQANFVDRILKKDRGLSRSAAEAINYRKSVRIGMPRVLNMWSTGPFWRTYFETLGVSRANIVFSDETSEAMFSEGSSYGSVDPCFPSKVVQSHIHNLLFNKHREKRPLNYLFFPSLTHIPSFLENVMDTASCPIVAGTPNVIKAAFTKEQDFFERFDVDYVDSALSMNEPLLFKRQLYKAWGDRLRVTEGESDFAVDQAWLAMEQFNQIQEHKGERLLDQMEATGKVGILMLGRPYHNDPGINHEITEEFQAMGYPVLSIRSIPKRKEWLERFFGDGVNPLDIGDVWPENYSANSAQKVWAAKFAARHPNIAVLDLSSFKCGHDAPTYGLIDDIISTAGAPYAAMHDIDANKPAGSIKIRVKTYAHALRRREEMLQSALDKDVPLATFEPLLLQENEHTENIDLIPLMEVSA